jgi:hypothetical protein
MVTVMYDMFVTPTVKTVSTSVVVLAVMTKWNLFAYWPFSMVGSLVSEFFSFVAVMVGTASLLLFLTMVASSRDKHLNKNDDNDRHHNSNSYRGPQHHRRRIFASSPKKRKRYRSPPHGTPTTATTTRVPDGAGSFGDIDVRRKLTPSSSSSFVVRFKSPDRTAIAGSTNETGTRTKKVHVPTPFPLMKMKKSSLSMPVVLDYNPGKANLVPTSEALCGATGKLVHVAIPIPDNNNKRSSSAAAALREKQKEIHERVLANQHLVGGTPKKKKREELSTPTKDKKNSFRDKQKEIHERVLANQHLLGR